MAISPSKDAVVVKMNGVPAPPAGKVYQMWLIPKDGSAPVSQGLMDAQALSKPAVVKGIDSAAALGITVEPAGGSAARPCRPSPPHRWARSVRTARGTPVLRDKKAAQALSPGEGDKAWRFRLSRPFGAVPTR